MPLVNGIEITCVSCGACSHWCLRDDNSMYCQFYGMDCKEVKNCPVRSLDFNLAQKKLAWAIIKIIKDHRRYLMRDE